MEARGTDGLTVEERLARSGIDVTAEYEGPAPVRRDPRTVQERLSDVENRIDALEVLAHTHDTAANNAKGENL